MDALAEIKTTSRQFRVWWPSVSDTRDFRMWGQVGAWIHKQAKALDRKPPSECCKLLGEQFPELSEIEVRDYTGRGMRLTR